jgi:hypothetical protein
MVPATPQTRLTWELKNLERVKRRNIFVKDTGDHCGPKVKVFENFFIH